MYHTNYNEFKKKEIDPPETTVDFITSDVTISFDGQDAIKQTKKAEESPSAVLFYWIDDEETLSSGVLSNFQTKFNSKYKKNEPSGGVPLYVYPKDGEQLEGVVEEYTPSSESSTTEEDSAYEDKKHYRFYYPTLFSYTEGEAISLVAPSYFVPPTTYTDKDTKTGATEVKFKIKQGVDKTKSETYKKILLEYTDADGTLHTYELRRYNNKDFMSDDNLPHAGNFTQFKSENADYYAFNSGVTDSTVVYVHFVVAFVTTKGEFNNVFWSTLSSDSALTFPLTLDTFMEKKAEITQN